MNRIIINSIEQINRNNRAFKIFYEIKMPTLHEACLESDIELIKSLIEKGADINKQENYTRCLSIACFKNDIKVVKYLIDKGADVNIEDCYGETYLYWECLKYNTNMEIVKCLVENGANINKQNKMYKNSLHIACHRNKTELAKYLVDNGANVNIQNKAGDSSLHIAFNQKNIELLKYLVDNGADVNLERNNEKTILYEVCIEKNVELIKYLEFNGGTFGEEIENIYNMFHKSSDNIRKEVQEYIEDDNQKYFPSFEIKYFNDILGLEIIPDKYKFFKSDEFKEKLLVDVINQLVEDNCEYKGRLLFYMKGVDHVKDKVRENLKQLRLIKI